MALRAHRKLSGFHFSVLHPPENLLGLALDFFFFVFDERHYVIGGVERGHSGITGAGKGLQGGYDDGLEAKALLERGQSECQHDGRTVGVGDDIAARGKLSGGALRLKQFEMGVIHLRNQERDIRLHAPGCGIADHRITGAGKFLFYGVGHIRRQAGKNDVAIQRRMRCLDADGLHCVGHPAGEPPGAGVCVGLAFGAVRGGQRGDLKLGVAIE